jgi:hypothetical protein
MITARLGDFPPELQPTTPLLVSDSGTGFRSKTCNVWPPATRFAAIGVPMIPSPTNPTFI